MEEQVTPNPGSPIAVAGGCTCAIGDNGHGAGFRYGGSSSVCFWISDDCPIHGEDDYAKDSCI